MGTHCLGPFVLTNLLQDVMRHTAKLESSKPCSVRILFVTSLLQLGAPAGGIQFDQQGTPKVLKAFPNYMESKVGSAWLAYEYSKRLDKDGILCLVSLDTKRCRNILADMNRAFIQASCGRSCKEQCPRLPVL
jgi:NAD(P)-dependent dehydrogenase (short-subunit alcohol dehydrogenase family)